MSIQTKETLKSYFQTGDVPTQAQFEDFIDSSVGNSQAGIEGTVVITEGVDENTGKIFVGEIGQYNDVWYYPDVDMTNITFTSIEGSGWFDIVSDTANYVVANGVSGTWEVVQDASYIDYLNIIPYMLIFRRNGSSHMHKQNIELQAHGDIELHHQRVYNCNRYDRESSALTTLSVDGNFDIQLNGGYVWSVNHRNLINDASSSTEHYICTDVEGTYYYYDYNQPHLDVRYYSGSDSYYFGNTESETGLPLDTTTEGWMYRITTSGDTDWESYGASAGFQDGDLFQATSSLAITGTGELQSFLRILRPQYWSTQYIYRGIENEDHLYSFYDNVRYDSLELAQTAKSLPAIPPMVAAHAMLVGRIIFKGQTIDNVSEVVCESAFDTIFAASSSVINHNTLLGRDDTQCHPQYVTASNTVLTELTTTDTIATDSLCFNTVTDINESDVFNIDWRTGNCHYVNWTNNTTINFTYGPYLSSHLTLRLKKTNTDTNDITFTTSIAWPSGVTPTWTKTDNGEDIIHLYNDGGGTNRYYGNAWLDVKY